MVICLLRVVSEDYVGELSVLVGDADGDDAGSQFGEDDTRSLGIGKGVVTGCFLDIHGLFCLISTLMRVNVKFKQKKR